MKPEELAHWYLRFNGFFTISNFVVHPTRRGSQLTDGDIAGVRFPNRAEFPEGPGADDAIFKAIGTMPYFVLTEVKRTLCELNPSWRTPPHTPVVSLLQDLGPFTEPEKVAAELIASGCHKTGDIYASLLFIGETFGSALPVNAPKRSWKEIIEFIHDRFREFRRIKADHAQWDGLGHELWRYFETTGNKDAFVAAVRSACQLT